MFTRRRTWAMLAAIALIPILLAVAVALTSDQLAPGEGPPFLDRVTQNGLFTGFTATLLALPLFLPLTMAVVAGDTIAGEASLGTLRYLLIAPVGRLRLLVVKYLGTIVFALAGTFTLMLAGGIIGAILFPIGPSHFIVRRSNFPGRINRSNGTRRRIHSDLNEWVIGNWIICFDSDHGPRWRNGCDGCPSWRKSDS
tara:strand:- start:480 stop:1070 length:591 start_codon:yes stop_codon:yes gene_type:complete